MNDYSNTSNSAGLLKSVYKGTGPVSQMNNNGAMLQALRKKRDMLKVK